MSEQVLLIDRTSVAGETGKVLPSGRKSVASKTGKALPMTRTTVACAPEIALQAMDMETQQ